MFKLTLRALFGIKQAFSKWILTPTSPFNSERCSCGQVPFCRHFLACKLLTSLANPVHPFSVLSLLLNLGSWFLSNYARHCPSICCWDLVQELIQLLFLYQLRVNQIANLFLACATYHILSIIGIVRYSLVQNIPVKTAYSSKVNYSG